MNLAAVASHYLGVSLDKTEQTGDWSGALSDSQLAYAASDSRILLQLWDCLAGRLRENGLERIADIEFACAPALARAEYDGISLDLGQWEHLCTDIQNQYEMALQALYAYSGEPSYQLTLWGGEEALDVNFDSNAYVLKLLKKNGIQVSSTSRYSLAPYHNHPLVKALTEYRKYAQLLSGFLHPLPGRSIRLRAGCTQNTVRSALTAEECAAGGRISSKSQGKPVSAAASGRRRGVSLSLPTIPRLSCGWPPRFQEMCG